MTNKNAILKLKVLGLENSIIDEIFVENQHYEIKNELSIDIKFNEFESEFCSKIVNLELVHDKKKILHNFEVIEGINFGILFTKFGKTIDLIFYDNYNLKVVVGAYKCQANEINIPFISGIQRIILINMSKGDLVFINGEDFTDEILKISKEESIQISMLNIKKKIIPYKIIKEKEDNEFLKIFQDYENEGEKFSSLIKKFDKGEYNINDKKYIEKLKSEIEQKSYLSNIINFKFNLPRNILLKYYNEKNILILYQYVPFLILLKIFSV